MAKVTRSRKFIVTLIVVVLKTVVNAQPSDANHHALREQSEKTKEKSPLSCATANSVQEETASGWTANEREGVRFESEDGQFVIQPGLAFSLRNTNRFVEDQPSDVLLSLRLARLGIRGNLFRKWFSYGFLAEFAGRSGPSLLDAEIGLNIRPEFRVRVGQFRTPFSRAFLTPLVHLHFPGRAILSDYFRAGRDVGLQIEGDLLDGKLEYYAGVFHGGGTRMTRVQGSDLLYVGRLAYSVFEKTAYDDTPIFRQRYSGPSLSFGIAGYHKSVPLDVIEGVEAEEGMRDQNGLEVDAAFYFKSFSAMAEWFFRWDHVDGTDWIRRTGGYLQVGQFVYDHHVDVVARFNLMFPNHQALETKFWRLEVGGNLYLVSDHFKLQLLYRYDDVDGASSALPVAQTSHQLILQAQAYY